MSHFLRSGTAGAPPYALAIDPERAGWAFCGLRVLELPGGGSHTFDTGEDELIVLPLRAAAPSCCDDDELPLDGRDGVFAGVTDFAYVPRDAQVAIEHGARRPLRAPLRPRRAPAGAAPRAPRPTCRSSCAARAGPAARSTTSARRTRSTPTG